MPAQGVEIGPEQAICESIKRADQLAVQAQAQAGETSPVEQTPGKVDRDVDRQAADQFFDQPENPPFWRQGKKADTAAKTANNTAWISNRQPARKRRSPGERKMRSGMLRGGRESGSAGKVMREIHFQELNWGILPALRQS